MLKAIKRFSDQFCRFLFIVFHAFRHFFFNELMDIGRSVETPIIFVGSTLRQREGDLGTSHLTTWGCSRPCRLRATPTWAQQIFKRPFIPLREACWATKQGHLSRQHAGKVENSNTPVYSNTFDIRGLISCVCIFPYTGLSKYWQCNCFGVSAVL